MYEGKLVRLRAYRKDELELVKNYVNDPEVMHYTTPRIPYPYTLEDEEKWYADNSAVNETYNFAIETKETKEYLGGCGINKIDWKNSVVEVGIFIGNKEYWGKGYGTDAMRVLVKFIFEQMNINKVSLQVFSFNKRAQRSYEKVGFKVEGILRQELFKDGAYHDKICMGILKNEVKYN